MDSRKELFMKTKNRNKYYWYFLLPGTLIITILRIVSLVFSAVINHKLMIHAQLSESSMTTLQNFGSFFISEARWICYLVMFLWALFWIENQFHTSSYILGIASLWLIQFFVIYIVFRLCSAFITSEIPVTSILFDCFLNSWPRMIIIGSVIIRIYNKKKNHID